MSGNGSFKWPPFPRRDTKQMSLAPTHASVKMNFAMRTTLVVVLAVLTVGVGATPAATPKRVNLAQLARTLVKSGSPGAIVYVRTPSATRAGVAGYADRNAHISMRAADRWRVASLTKTFVSVVVLQLEAEGKLDIDDPVEKYLPGLVPNGSSIALRELLNHTSGLFDYGEAAEYGAAVLDNPGRTWAPLELVRFGVAQPPYFAPGQNYHYSNTNYILLGLVVEAVDHKPLAQSLQERIFTPLNLTASSLPSAIELAPDFVHGYISLNGSPLIDLAPLLSPSIGWAAGGMVSNARDVTTFYRSLLTGKLLPPVQLKEMETPSAVAGTYGLGLSISFTSCGRTYGHLGDFAGAWRTGVLATRNGKRQAVVTVNVDEEHVDWLTMESLAERALCRG
jgi:D-alanyl-D-alanine carboxypeptidase